MNKMLEEIMKEFSCTREEAATILDNILNKSNIARMAVIAGAKREYDLR